MQTKQMACIAKPCGPSHLCSTALILYVGLAPQVVEFLKRPERFTAVGAKIPKGVLLIGPPGETNLAVPRTVVCADLLQCVHPGLQQTSWHKHDASALCQPSVSPASYSLC